jgi:hypothetical protein
LASAVAPRLVALQAMTKTAAAMAIATLKDSVVPSVGHRSTTRTTLTTSLRAPSLATEEALPKRLLRRRLTARLRLSRHAASPRQLTDTSAWRAPHLWRRHRRRHCAGRRRHRRHH